MNNQKQNSPSLPGAIIIAGALLSLAIIMKWTPQKQVVNVESQANITEAILDDGSNILPADVEKKMLTMLVAEGIIEPNKLPYVTELNLLWAYGLANKNRILDDGPMKDIRFGSPEKMASVGGWTASRGLVMDHYSMHRLSVLSADRQEFVEKITKGIYRPCCDNPTHFPDCNHGMAMLGLMEYLAAIGATEDQMWNAAMKANINWFPEQYGIIGQYLKERDLDINNQDPQDLLGYEYSSASGFAKIASQVKNPDPLRGSEGCGIDSGQPARATKQTGCAI